MKHKALIHAALLGLQAELAAGTVPTSFGICTYLDCHFGGNEYDGFEDELRNLMRLWPKASGNAAYPVPAPSNYQPRPNCAVNPAQDHFWRTAGGVARWDANTEYGASRRELLAWLIEQTKG